MEQEGPSFWADIKKYEDTLERDPNSYCFAPLSELYRKLGMVDDAINIARRGCELHPEYVGGYMSLGRAYFEKGMNGEAKVALEKVVRVTPDNLLAQRLLSKIYLDEGDVNSAGDALKSILAQNPDDSESRMLLESLVRSSAPESQQETGLGEEYPGVGVDEAITQTDDIAPIEEFEELIDLDECEIIEELDSEHSNGLKEEEYVCQEIVPPVLEDESTVAIRGGGEPDEKDPLTTATLAELYVSQGYHKKALAIYRELLDAEPENIELINRIHSLKQEIDEDEESGRYHSLDVDFEDDVIDESVPEAGIDFSASESPSYPHETPEQAGIPETDAFTFDESRIENIDSDVSAEQSLEMPSADISFQAETESIISSDDDSKGGDRDNSSSDENVIRTFEIWLENIKRRR